VFRTFGYFQTEEEVLAAHNVPPGIWARHLQRAPFPLPEIYFPIATRPKEDEF